MMWATSRSARRMPRGLRGTIVLALFSIAMLAAAAGIEPGCSFGKTTNVGCSEPSEPECDGEERLPGGLGELECRVKCCEDPWCGGWRYHPQHGCWHSYGSSLDAECFARNSSQNCKVGGWRGETQRSGATVASSQVEGGSDSRANCCPGRWCCHMSEECCPTMQFHPGAIDTVAVSSTAATAANDATALREVSLPGKLDMELLIDEGINGLLWVCEKGGAGSSLRYFALSRCLPDDTSDVLPPHPLLQRSGWYYPQPIFERRCGDIDPTSDGGAQHLSALFVAHLSVLIDTSPRSNTRP